MCGNDMMHGREVSKEQVGMTACAADKQGTDE
jgi:hypothetical protein